MEQTPEYYAEQTFDSENNDRIRHKYKLTVEVPLFISFLAMAITAVPTTNLLMYRSCVHPLSRSVDECRSFLAPEKTNHTIENEVQRYSNFVWTVKSVLESIVPAVMSVFVSVWSDKHGRKPMLMWPLLGSFMTNVMVVVYSMIPSLGPWWYVATVIPFSLSGGFVVLITASMCYVNDISSNDSKSVRLLYVQLSIAVSTAMGSLICPLLLRGLGNISNLFLAVAALSAIAYYFTAVFIKESLITATPGTILTVLNIEHVKKMIRVCFTKKPNYGRAISLLIIMASALSTFSAFGISGVLYLYVRNTIHWTLKDFTTFTAISTVICFVGSTFAIGLLQRLFHISDIILSIAAFSSCILEYSIKMFATKTWHMYFGSAVSLFGTVSAPLLRSIQTKVVPASDIGQVFALQSSAESICPLLTPVIYNTLYSYTMDIFPGAFFLLSSGINVACILILAIVLYFRRKSSSVDYAYQIINNETDI